MWFIGGLVIPWEEIRRTHRKRSPTRFSLDKVYKQFMQVAPSCRQVFDLDERIVKVSVSIRGVPAEIWIAVEDDSRSEDQAIALHIIPNDTVQNIFVT